MTFTDYFLSAAVISVAVCASALVLVYIRLPSKFAIYSIKKGCSKHYIIIEYKVLVKVDGKTAKHGAFFDDITRYLNRKADVGTKDGDCGKEIRFGTEDSARKYIIEKAKYLENEKIYKKVEAVITNRDITDEISLKSVHD